RAERGDGGRIGVARRTMRVDEDNRIGQHIRKFARRQEVYLVWQLAWLRLHVPHSLHACCRLPIRNGSSHSSITVVRQSQDAGSFGRQGSDTGRRDDGGSTGSTPLRCLRGGVAD